MNSASVRGRDVGEFPAVILLDSVSYCNLKCSMCFHKDMERPKGFMPWDLFTKCIDEIAIENKDARVWLVFFGEPLIRSRYKPTIFDMIAYAKSKGLTDVVLNSNANLMTESASRKFIEAGLDAIYIGLDAFSADTYAKVRVGGNYEQTVQNVNNLIRIKRELGVSNPRVYTQFVEMKVNEHEKDDFIEYWTEQGAEVKIRPMVTWAGQVSAEQMTAQQVEKNSEERWSCYWAMQSMSVTDRGKVVTCAVDLDAQFVAGDAHDRSLKEIWNTDLKALREMHLTKQFQNLPDHCRDCQDWQAARAEYY